MDELNTIIEKYKKIDIENELKGFETSVKFSALFYQDVADIFDAFTRIKNTERNPDGYNHNDAAILGQLVRIWKILKEVVYYYKNNNGDIISLLDRPIIESAAIATYLLQSNPSVIEDYRKCSYKSRLKLLENAKNETLSDFYKSSYGQRLIISIKKKLESDGFDLNSFENQKKHGWKVSGKNFKQILDDIGGENLYEGLYGIASESIHGSWGDSLDYHIIGEENGLYRIDPFYQQVDMRFVTPVVKICIEPYTLWLKRIEAYSEQVDS